VARQEPGGVVSGYRVASAVAMEEEYTINQAGWQSPQQKRGPRPSERSYSALDALRAKTYVRLTQQPLTAAAIPRREWR